MRKTVENGFVASSRDGFHTPCRQYIADYRLKQDDIGPKPWIPSYQTTKTAVFRRFQASAAEQGARRAWLLSDAKSFGFHGFSLGSWLLWLSLPVLLALMVVAFLCSCGFCLWLSLAWDCLVLIGFDGWRCFFPFVAVPGAERPFIRIF